MKDRVPTPIERQAQWCMLTHLASTQFWPVAPDRFLVVVMEGRREMPLYCHEYSTTPDYCMVVLKTAHPKADARQAVTLWMGSIVRGKFYAI